MVLKVQQFLCFKLETGGVIIGFVDIVAAISVSCSWIFKIIKLISKRSCLGNSIGECESYLGLLVVLCVLVAVISLGCAYIGYETIMATESRIAFRLIPMMYMLGIVIFLSPLLLIYSLVVYSFVYFVIGLTCFLWHFYLFIVVASIYSLFKAEHARKDGLLSADGI